MQCLTHNRSKFPCGPWVSSVVSSLFELSEICEIGIKCVYLIDCAGFHNLSNAMGPPAADLTQDGEDKNRGPDGANLFIYHLPQNYTESHLEELFRPYGTILSTHVYRDRNTNQSRGFGA